MSRTAAPARGSGRRVVVTGLGVTSPIGTSLDASVQALRAGRSGVRRMPAWDDIEDMQGKLGAVVDPALDLKAHFPRKRRRTMGRVAQLAVHATDQAVAQAGLGPELLEHDRTGVAFGSTHGSSEETESYSRRLSQDRTMRGLDPNAYFKIMTHTCAVNVAQAYRVRGRVASTCTACTSGSQALGRGFELVRAGVQDRMICGGAEELHYTSAVTFDLLMATSTRYLSTPSRTPRPFDADRDGLVVGEGAGALILEDLEAARARGATPLGEVLGYATNCDGAHISAPREDGMRRVMELALADAGLAASAIDFVCAHATGTEIGDLAESLATRAAFGRAVPVASLKGYVGHTLGACGAIEAAWCFAMIGRGFLAATLNLERVDPRCGDLDYVREQREVRPRLVMSNNFAFGGINTSLVLGPPPGDG
ncbi:MAG: beta-ketoacyl-ACP synthase [Sandaracinaceae bacterium]